MFRTIENHHAPKAKKFSCFRILPMNSYDKLTTKIHITYEGEHIPDVDGIQFLPVEYDGILEGGYQ